MYIKEAHILIEQGLQNIGVFAYSDMHPDEIDLAIHTEEWKILEEEFTPLQGKPAGVSKIQASLDKYKDLIIKEYPVTTSLVDGLYVGDLPSDYYHNIKNRSIVLYECATCRITSGNIVTDTWYVVKGRPITYNTVVYTEGQIFKGVVSVSTYTVAPSTTDVIVLELKRRSSPNRLTEEEFVDDIIDNALTRPNIESPVSTITGTKIAVYVKDFFVEKVYMSYLRKPKIPYLSFTKYTSASTLIVGVTYEVISGSITYNSNPYLARPQYQFDNFIAVTGHTSFTGTGIVRVKDEGDIELPRQISLKVVDNTIIRLASISEQSQQKVVNLAQLAKQ